MLRHHLAALILAFVPTILGHGGAMHYLIDGIEYAGSHYKVLNNDTGTIQREWTWDGVDERNMQDLPCGIHGAPFHISYHAPIRAGNKISINYTVPDSSPPWTFGHPYGPMLAYMAACPNSGCESVDLLAPIWFKVWQAGLESGNYVDGTWAMKAVMDGANLDIETPKALKPGKYLFRHEMVNLQTGPVQIFPNCIQLEVSSNSMKQPEVKNLVAFPGAYDAAWGTSWPAKGGDSRWFYVDHLKDTVYTFPGPPIWQA